MRPDFGEAIAMIRPLGEAMEDAERWWQAYLLAEHDQVEGLRERADAGGEHARRQLASWLSERARTEEAIEVVRPLADAGDDVADLWLARWLAERDHAGELRQRAASGDYHALVELAGWLARHGRLGELRDLVVQHRQLLAGWLARQGGIGDMRLVRLAADLGDDAARRRLEHWLARLHERAAAGDEHARQFLAEHPEWR
jgi:hypothetical protein